jgi:hypothetical protein
VCVQIVGEMVFVGQQLTDKVTPKTVDFIRNKNLMCIECTRDVENIRGLIK